MRVEMKNRINNTWKTLARKRVNDDDSNKGEMVRVLGLFDLTNLGLGATLGLGVYTLAGKVAKESAGPAVCISFLIAAIASSFAGLCYAEFAARVPKSGSAYVYSYVTVGEFIAFVIGWNLVFEYFIATAGVARNLSSNIDNLLDHKISNFLNDTMPMRTMNDAHFFTEYPDFFAFTLVVFMTMLLSFGVRESATFNNLFTIVNLTTIGVMIISGIINADTKNWSIPKENIPAEHNQTDKGVVNNGGFLPYGWSGVLAGASTSFIGFVGFDGIATANEEAKSPQRNIPYAIILTLGIVLVIYFCIAVVLTMMLPYYELNVDTPFPIAFRNIQWNCVFYIVTGGCVFAMSAALMGAFYPLPRVLYSMGDDGLIFRFFAKINKRTKTPLYGTVVSGIFSGAMTLLFDLSQLLDMSSIGTLMAFAMVAVCVLILRYKAQSTTPESPSDNNLTNKTSTSPKIPLLSRILNLERSKEPTKFSGDVAKWSVFFFSIASLIFGQLFNLVEFLNTNNANFPVIIFVYVLLGLVGAIVLLSVVVIGRQPVQEVQLSFKVPLVPLIPCLSIFINMYLMCQFDGAIWIRFVVWMVIGFGIYFFYGMSHSSAASKKQDVQLTEDSRATIQ